MHRDAVGDEAAGDRLGQVEDLLLAERGEGGDVVEVRVELPAPAARDGEGNGVGELLELRARQQADVLGEKAELTLIKGEIDRINSSFRPAVVKLSNYDGTPLYHLYRNYNQRRPPKANC